MEKPTLSVLTLNASLKPGSELSSTGEVVEQVVSAMRAHADVTHEEVRLSDLDLPVGLRFRMSETDAWPGIVEKIHAADIVLFATPIWWGGRSSLMQRVIERLDSLDEGEGGGRESLLNKVAGIVITGSEDGAQAVAAGLMEVLSFLNFTLPPQCTTYWVGEVGQDPKTDNDRRRINPAVGEMAEKTARSLASYAILLKDNPQSS
ncbi:MAG: NAD(P)H-dependent oxidoreductase [Patescibacteria group bacterium]